MNEMRTKYSIITPVYNSECYLKECIESVISQTYTEWELILIDDGSTDGSAKICDDYANKDSRIKVVHIQNSGAYIARIMAIDYIDGDYTIGLDSDDMYESNCLELVEKARYSTNADVILFGRTQYDELKKSYQKENFIYEDRSTYKRKELLEIAIGETDHSLGNKAIKSDIYKRRKYINESYRLSLSLDFLQLVPLLCEVESAYAIDEALYICRIRNESLSHSYKFSHILDNDWINNTIREYLISEGLFTSQIRLALEKSYVMILCKRLFGIKGKITSKERKIIRKLPFLNSMSNEVEELNDNMVHKALLRYINRGFFGPWDICYKIFLKCYLRPLKEKQRFTNNLKIL